MDMARHRKQMNLFTCALLDTLPDTGMPESHAYLAAEKLELNGIDAVNTLIELGVLKRALGPTVVPGPIWGKCKREYEAFKAECEEEDNE